MRQLVGVEPRIFLKETNMNKQKQSQTSKVSNKRSFGFFHFLELESTQ
jgi:hypothetical protein